MRLHDFWVKMGHFEIVGHLTHFGYRALVKMGHFWVPFWTQIWPGPQKALVIWLKNGSKKMGHFGLLKNGPKLKPTLMSNVQI